MKYKEWFDENKKKRDELVKKLKKKGFNNNQILNYFNYNNMKIKEPNYCPLYKTNEKCHNIKDLNCYYCACPYFRFNDNAKKIKSFCSINSKYGKKIEFNDVIHQDCSNCLIPHKIKKIFEEK